MDNPIKPENGAKPLKNEREAVLDDLNELDPYELIFYPNFDKGEVQKGRLLIRMA